MSQSVEFKERDGMDSVCVASILSCVPEATPPPPPLKQSVGTPCSKVENIDMALIQRGMRNLQ